MHDRGFWLETWQNPALETVTVRSAAGLVRDLYPTADGQWVKEPPGVAARASLSAGFPPPAWLGIGLFRRALAGVRSSCPGHSRNAPVAKRGEQPMFLSQHERRP